MTRSERWAVTLIAWPSKSRPWSRRKESLLGDVSHELRSPLARMIVALGLLKHASPEEMSEYVNRIGIEAERLDKMIGQLLTLTRIESGARIGPTREVRSDEPDSGGRR